ncbi:MAG: 30S ribosomal protein S4 [Candidatus Aenigmatarchaeota archaeon]
MGSPKKLRKNWSRPKKPFDRTRIEYEAGLEKEYGFKRKKEIWKVKRCFKNIKRRARNILATHDEADEKALLAKLQKYGLADKNFTLDDVLNMKLEDFCERRLQTVMFRKGMANTVKHARQMITHRNVLIGDTVVDMPNYLVALEEEKKIKFREKKPKPKEAPKVEEKPVEEGSAEAAPKAEKKEEDISNPYL